MQARLIFFFFFPVQDAILSAEVSRQPSPRGVHDGVFFIFLSFLFREGCFRYVLMADGRPSGDFQDGDPPPCNNVYARKLTWKPVEVAQRELSWPKMEALLTLPVATRLLSTYDCQDMMIDVCGLK